jgi:four helix bundle protein
MRRRHREIAVWSEAMDLVVEVYRLSAFLPKEEVFGLTAQMRRAAVSIPSNLAEGAARGGTKELVQFISIALGSAAELDAQIEIASRLGMVSNTETLQARLDSVASQLSAMRSRLRAKARS